jgi:hypothetical protein
VSSEGVSFLRTFWSLPGVVGQHSVVTAALSTACVSTGHCARIVTTLPKASRQWLGLDFLLGWELGLEEEGSTSTMSSHT